MSSEQAWSITDWQCGMGIVDSCRNQKVNWDEPRTWQLIVDQMIPLAEFGLVFGMQYISSSIGPGTTKAMNSIRCMLNSGVSSSWYLGAGGWLFLKYVGLSGDLLSYLDEGYLYVCTCIYDLNGLKSMLGQSDESNAAFSICSEAAGRERIKANEEKRSYEEKQREAAAVAVQNAANNKRIADTKESMQDLDGCSLRNSSTLENEKCYAAVKQFEHTSALINRYWSNMVWSSGGTESTKNREEQTNLQESNWTMLGVVEGLRELYPDRHDENGNLLQSCTDPTTTLVEWGDTCTDIISQWATDNGSPTALCQGDACQDSIQCYQGNDAANASMTTDAQCDLVELQYGYSQWQESASITCSDPATLQNLVGFANCMQVDGTWQARSAYTNPDQPRFRSIGETVGSVTVTNEGAEDEATTMVQGSVRDEEIQCLAADNVTVRTGLANCWAYWIEGATVEIGVGSNGQPIKNDNFVWLTNEGISCGVGVDGNDLVGTEACKIASRVTCNSSKLARLNLSDSSSSICIPTLTWEAR